MANDLTIPRGYTLDREAKNGKITTFNVIGIISRGKQDERNKLAAAMVAGVIGNEDNRKNYHLVLDDVARVFPESYVWMRSIRNKLEPGRAETCAFLENIVLLRGRNGAPLKAEKAAVQARCLEVIAAYNDDLAAKEARRIAFEAEEALKAEKAKQDEENRTVDAA